jgi:hypothetical protein
MAKKRPYFDIMHPSSQRRNNTPALEGSKITGRRAVAATAAATRSKAVSASRLTFLPGKA